MISSAFTWLKLYCWIPAMVLPEVGSDLVIVTLAELQLATKDSNPMGFNGSTLALTKHYTQHHDQMIQRSVTAWLPYAQQSFIEPPKLGTTIQQLLFTLGKNLGKSHFLCFHLKVEPLKKWMLSSVFPNLQLW